MSTEDIFTVKLRVFIKRSPIKRGIRSNKLEMRLFAKDVDEASLNRVQLERKIDSLQDEIHFLKKTHDEVRVQLKTKSRALLKVFDEPAASLSLLPPGAARVTGADRSPAGSRRPGRVQTGPDRCSERHQAPVRDRGLVQHAGDGGVVPIQGGETRTSALGPVRRPPSSYTFFFSAVF